MKSIIPEPMQVVIGQRGFGKLAYLKEILPVLMAKNDFISASYKATTIIKLKDYDDCFVFYGSDLKKHISLEIGHYRPKKQKEFLQRQAELSQRIFAANANSIYGGFNYLR